jgi:Transposase DDE domain
MERELWSELSRAVRAVAARWREPSARFTHPTAVIVLVHLWSTLRDRPTCWACDGRNWDAWARPPHTTRPTQSTLPTQSTVSRRKRTRAFAAFMDAVGARLAGRPSAALVKRLDGKALHVPAHSGDRDARWGWGTGQDAKGYKLHAVWADRPMPEQWALTPLNACERHVARRMVKRLSGGGYLLADTFFDESQLHDRAAAANHQLVAPRRPSRRGASLAHRYQSRHRIRCIEMTEPPAGVNRFGRTLWRQRAQIERDFGNLCGFGGGLAALPPWARRIWRVRPWVHGKLLINAARIRCLRRRRRAVDA